MDFEAVDIDEVRSYWNSRPCNIKHSPAPVGSKEYFDQVEARKYFVEPHIPGFAQFQRWAGKKVLEIGCGIGTDTINFARAGANVTAVDLSEVSLDLARRRAEIYGLGERVDFLVADAENLSQYLDPQPYDLVYSFGVVHHSPHPERIMDQVRHHFLRRGSTVKVMVYHRNSWKVLSILLRGRGAFWKLNELIAESSEAQSGSPVTYAYSRRSVASLFHGLEVTDMFVEHIFPYRVEDYIRYRYRREWYFQLIPGTLFRKLERAVGWHLCVTARCPEPSELL